MTMHSGGPMGQASMFFETKSATRRSLRPRHDLMRELCSIHVGLAVLIVLNGCQDELIDYDQYESKPSASIQLQLTAITEAEVKSILSGFAATHGYELVTRRVHPSKPRFMIAMWRPDSLILMRNPFETNEYRISIYRAREDSPMVTSMKNTLDVLKSEVMGKTVPNKAQQQMVHE